MLRRICEEAGVPELVEILADRVSGSDLQSLMMEVYARRSKARPLSSIFQDFSVNGFSRPSAISPQTFLEFDQKAFAIAQPPFQAIELSPLCPLGTIAGLTPVSQDKAIATMRNLEVVSDSTNALALECSLRRRAAPRDEVIKLCASHRLVRPAGNRKPGDLAHFRMFGMCTAGRDKGSFEFERAAVIEQVGILMSIVRAVAGGSAAEWRVTLTDFSGTRAAAIEELIGDLSGLLDDVKVHEDTARTRGRGYYDPICFEILCRSGDEEYSIADGGFTDWTQRLLNDRKERLLIAGLGSERVCSIFGIAQMISRRR